MATKKTTPSKGEKRPKMKDDLNVGSGVFSNIVNVSLSPREVFLDFGLGLPEEHVRLMSRIILTKEHALELRDVLTKSLKVYEE